MTDLEVEVEHIALGKVVETKVVPMGTFVKSWRLYKGKITQELPGCRVATLFQVSTYGVCVVILCCV